MPGEELLEKRCPDAEATTRRRDEHALETRCGPSRPGTNAGKQTAHGYVAVVCDECEAVTVDAGEEIGPAGRRLGEGRVCVGVVATRAFRRTKGAVEPLKRREVGGSRRTDGDAACHA